LSFNYLRIIIANRLAKRLECSAQRNTKNMKSLETIAYEASPKDYYVVAEIADCSQKNVKMVVKGKRGDNFNIQQIFSGLLDAKTELIRKYRKNKKRKID